MVDGNGVGLGTKTPALDVHLRDGDSPTLRLQQDGTQNFIWDILGNESTFSIRDAFNGLSEPFRIAPNAPTNSINIAGNGDIGIGTDSPSRA